VQHRLAAGMSRAAALEGRALALLQAQHVAVKSRSTRIARWVRAG
jgi:hypothetical protein